MDQVEHGRALLVRACCTSSSRGTSCGKETVGKRASIKKKNNTFGPGLQPLQTPEDASTVFLRYAALFSKLQSEEGEGTSTKTLVRSG